MLVVRSDQQGRGLGARLVAYVEELCRAEGVRLLLAETLGISEFAPQRAFYARCGYAEEARAGLLRRRVRQGDLP